MDEKGEHEVNPSFFSWFTSNFWLKVLSLFTAIVCWALVLGSQSVEFEKDIPLEISTADDVVIATEVPQILKVKLSGPQAFARAIQDRTESPIRVNFGASKPGKHSYRFIPSQIDLPFGVAVVSMEPNELNVKLEPLRKKEVPVEIMIQGVPPEGYEITEKSVLPEKIEVLGSQSSIKKIKTVKTLPIDVSETRTRFEKEVPFDLKGTSLTVKEAVAKVFLDVHPTTPNARIKNVKVKVIAEHRVRLRPRNGLVTILVRVSKDDLGRLDQFPSKVTAVIDLKNRPKGLYKEEVKIEVPANIGIVKVIPKEMEVTLY